MVRNLDGTYSLGKKNRRLQKALLIDAVGGGICKVHGEYLGIGKHHLRACPFCDIDEYYKRKTKKKI